MIMLILGLFDLGYTILESMILQQDLRLVGGYAIIYQDASTYDVTNSNVVDLLQNVAQYYVPNATIAAPVVQCSCDGSLSGTATCPASCSTPSVYITLSATVPYTPLLAFLNTLSPSAKYVVRAP